MNDISYKNDVITWIKSRYIDEMSIGQNSRRLAKACYFRLRPEQIDKFLPILIKDLKIDKQIFLDALEKERGSNNNREN